MSRTAKGKKKKLTKLSSCLQKRDTSLKTLYQFKNRVQSALLILNTTTSMLDLQNMKKTFCPTQAFKYRKKWTNS